MKIVPYVNFNKKQIDYYNCTACEILTNEIGLILPTCPRDNRYKTGIITTFVSGFIELAYKGISSFLHHKHQKALHKVVSTMERKLYLHHNKIYLLEDSMIMYGIYNSDTLEQLIETVYCMHNMTTWNEKILANRIHVWFEWSLSKDGVDHYAINSVLFLTSIREKCIKMYD